MQLRYKISIFLFFVSALYITAQINGESVYSFTKIPNSAHVAALGGANYSQKTGELSFALSNPALLDSANNKDFTFSWGWIADVDLGINAGNFAYAQKYKKYVFSLGTMFLNYGDFTAYDELGNSTGGFNAGDYMFYLSASRQLSKRFNAGVSLKPVISSLEDYSSFGILTDVGIAYNDTSRLFSAGLVLKNAGFQVTTYTDDERENVPWSLNLSISKKFRHAPFRVHLTYKDLQHYRLDYETSLDPDIQQLSGEENEESWVADVADNFIRHIVIGAELLLGKRLYGAFAYDIGRRKELSISENSGMTGMSIGFGLRLDILSISYGRYMYNPAAANNYLTLETNFEKLAHRFGKKSKEKSISEAKDVMGR